MKIINFFWPQKKPPQWHREINREAEEFWKRGKNLDYVLVYISPFGETQVIPVDTKNVNKAISLLRKIGRKK